MATFWLVTWLLILLAVSFALVPLFRATRSEAVPAADRMNLAIFRDQLAELEADVENGILGADQLEEGRLELERRFLEEADLAGEPKPPGATNQTWVLPILIGLALPVTTIFLYLHLGRIDLLSVTTPSAVASAAGPMHRDSLVGVVEDLASRLEAEPNDPRGWMMLGRSYIQLGEHNKAADAFGRVHDLVGDLPDVLVAYVDSRVTANGGRFDQASVSLVDRAMAVDPNHQKVIWLAGTAAFQQGDYSRALELWKRLADQAPPGSKLARVAAANIAEARALIGGEDPNQSNQNDADGSVE